MNKNKIIYLFLLIAQVLLAQTNPASDSVNQKAKPIFPGSEIEIYKIVPNPNNPSDSLQYVGYTRAEVTQALGLGEIRRDDANQGDDIGYRGLFLNYIDDRPENFNHLVIQKINRDPDPYNTGEKNPFVISKRHKLRIGGNIPLLMKMYRYEVYKTNAEGKVLGPLDLPTEIASKKDLLKYHFPLATPTGEMSDDTLIIDIHDDRIMRIYIGDAS